MTRYQETYNRLDQYIVRKMEESNLVGMSVALTDREKLLRVSTFGLSNLAGQILVTPDTFYEIGSIGKTFTSVLLLQQHEKGRIDLHAPIARYLPWFQVKSKYEPITVHHLMAHTAGIIDGTDIAPHAYFEVFAYDRIGLRCVLKNGVCAMSGTGAAKDGPQGRGYYIVKGRGVPRIDVVGYRDTVSWPRLMQQLVAITRSGAPTVN